MPLNHYLGTTRPTVILLDEKESLLDYTKTLASQFGPLAMPISKGTRPGTSPGPPKSCR